MFFLRLFVCFIPARASPVRERMVVDCHFCSSDSGWLSAATNTLMLVCQSFIALLNGIVVQSVCALTCRVSFIGFDNRRYIPRLV